MKKFKLFKTLLIAIGLLITSLTSQLWADTFTSDGDTYFYLENFSPTSGWGTAKWITNDCQYAWLDVYTQGGASSQATDAFELISGDHYRVKIPEGTWYYFVLRRGSTKGTAMNSTGNIGFSSGKNWLLTYGTATGWTDATWALNREFNGTEKIFIQNIVAEGMSDCWSKDDNFRLYVYLSEGTSNAVWCEAVVESSADYASSTVYSITPSPGCYRYIKLARNNQASFVYGSDGRAYTGNIDLDPSQNYISGNYKQNATTKTWSTFNLSPITSDGTKKLYFNMHPAGITTFGDDGYVMTYDTPGDGNFASFFGSAESKWSEHGAVQVDGDYYYIVVPEGTWNGWIITRQKQKDNPSWPAYNQTKDMFFTDNKKNYMYNWYDNGTTAYWSQYAPTPAIILNQGYPDEYIMSPSEGTTYTKGLSFDEHSTYEIKILDGETLYGLNNNVWTGPVSNYALASGEYQVRVATAGNGTYTFTYNQTGNTLSVAYPTVTKHPTADYCYLFDHGWSQVYVYLSDSKSGIAGTDGWGTRTTNRVQIGTDYYYYFAPGDYRDLMVSDMSNNNKATGLTPTLGKYQKNIDELWGWRVWNFAVTLHAQHTDEGATNPGNPSVEFYNTALSSADNTVGPPTRPGYTFGGYWNTSACNDKMVIGSNGGWREGIDGFTDSDRKWIHEGGTADLYAKWTPVEMLTFYGGAAGTGTDWGTRTNWSPACVPTIEHNVTIQKPVVVNAEHATAKSIIIDKKSPNSGNLTINANKGLEVAETITMTTDGSSYGATTQNDLILKSDEDGNASLIFDNSNGCQATVYMYSKATITGKGTEDAEWNWQYVGTPFTGSIPLYNYYGSWMYKWDNGWVAVNGNDELTPFAGYCLTQETATTHEMGGTLIATDKENPEDYKSIALADGKSAVIANSWTAPIYVGAFTTGGGGTFGFTPATIYLFNTGSAEGGADKEGTEAGTYVTVPVSASMVTGKEFIAPMQGFFIKNTSGSAGTITLNYNDLVRPGERSAIVAGAMKAPKKENLPNVLKIIANGSKYNDYVYILEREDFSTGFDNGWDGEKLNFGVESPSIYVINEPGKYDAVSSIPEFEGTKVGFRAGTDTKCTIRFEYNGSEELYLDDLKAKKSVQINDENTYTFTTSAEDDEARFVINKMPMHPTGIENTSYELNARKQLIDGTLYIIRDGKTYNAEGALVK